VVLKATLRVWHSLLADYLGLRQSSSQEAAGVSEEEVVLDLYFHTFAFCKVRSSSEAGRDRSKGRRVRQGLPDLHIDMPGDSGLPRTTCTLAPGERQV
jgi:hypothetical protein